MSTFQIPKYGEAYKENVFRRCNELISTTIWGGLTPTDFRKWCKNFQSDTELYFAACLLDALIYRSSAHTKALMYQLIDRVIPEILFATEPQDGTFEVWDRFMQSSYTRQLPIRFVPVVGLEDPPTKSGHAMARTLKHDMRFPERMFINPSSIEASIEKGVKLFIFIDDFMGSGQQFSKFATTWNLQTLLQSSVALYVPLAAHQTGLKLIRKEYPYIHVSCVEELGNTHEFFHPHSAAFKDDVNTPVTARAFYLEMLEKKNINFNDFTYGFDGLSLTYVFEHATPNNCLPLLWHNGAGKWTRLFNR